MAERNPPLYISGQSHSAEEDRLGISSVYGKTSGVIGSTDLAVSANGTPNMSVNVAAGRAVIVGTESSLQGAYHVTNDATKNLTISAANATNPRRDLIVAKVQDPAYSGATSSWSLVVVTGTAAASPADPTAPANAVVLARVSVAANATSITSGNITDLRPRAAGLSGIRVATSSTRPSSPVEGDFIYETDTDALKGYTTATTGWTAPWNLPWGTLGYASDGNLRAGFTTTAAEINSALRVSFTTPGNRRILLSGGAQLKAATGSPGYSFTVYTSGGTYVAQLDRDDRALTTGSKANGHHYVTPAAGTYTYTLYIASTSGTLDVDGSGLIPTWLSVEDAGPSGAPA